MKITQIIDQVLIIDDDPVSNHLSIDLIKKLGFAKDVIVKENGKEAIQYLQLECNGNDTWSALILLDLKMPVGDGFDFLEVFDNLYLRHKDKMIIVILTTSTNPDDIIRLRKMGRYYLINKPLTIDKLVDIYHRYFRGKA